MTSPIQPLPDHVILSPEFLRKHGKPKPCFATSKNNEDWWETREWTEIVETDYEDFLFSAPRSIVAAIDPEYVREWDEQQKLCGNCKRPKLEHGPVSGRCPKAHGDFADNFFKPQASEGTAEVPADSQAPSLTAGPPSGVTVSPEGGERLYPNFMCNIASRVLWLRQAIQKGEFTPQEAAKLARYTAPLPFEKELLSGKHEEVQRAITAMQQEAGQ